MLTIQEIDVYSCIDETSETDENILKIFNNECKVHVDASGKHKMAQLTHCTIRYVQEKGIYGIDDHDDNNQQTEQYCNISSTGCQAQANSQAVNPLCKLSDDDQDHPGIYYITA